jgi:hypothetical protein
MWDGYEDEILCPGVFSNPEFQSPDCTICAIRIIRLENIHRLYAGWI